MTRRKVVRASFEDLIQSGIIDLLNLCADPRTIYFHIPNGIPANAIAGARFKRLGMLAGAPDLLIITPDGLPHFIEVKSPHGFQSEVQSHFAARCGVIGVDYVICRSITAAEDILRSWGALGRSTGIRRAA